MAAEVREYRTRDLSLAGFLAENGFTLLRARRNPETRHFEFALHDPEDKAEEIAVLWSNSCCRRHENRLMSLKAMIGGKTNGNGNGKH